MLRRVAAALCLPALATPCAAAQDEPIRLPAVDVRAPYPLVPPQYRDTPRPAYPSAAREQRLEGTVLLDVQVRADGRVGDVQLKQTSGAPLLDEAALETVRLWTFVPARRGSRTVESWVEVPVRFSLVAR
jgi:periplasmic protein TonB